MENKPVLLDIFALMESQHYAKKGIFVANSVFRFKDRVYQELILQFQVAQYVV